MPAQPGSHIAGYRIVKLLGSGGMGDVYVVENEQLQRREAMKVISVAGASNEDFQQRFANEARTAASLNHPSIITVHGYGVADDLPWFTMSYLDGPDLASTRLTPAEAVDAIKQVAAGLDYAHGRSVVHRDVKPANIVVTRNSDGTLDRAVMLDFGIAKLSDSPQLTAVNSVVGTMAYTAPEIISGQPASGQSDQYSLACTVYNILTGHAPFTADTTTALMMAHIQQPPPPIGQARPDLAPLGPVIERAMAKDPSARFPDCKTFAAELERALGRTAAGTSTTMAPTPAPGVIGVPGAPSHGTPAPAPNYGAQQPHSQPNNPAAFASGPHSAPNQNMPSGFQNVPMNSGTQQLGPHQTGPQQMGPSPMGSAGGGMPPSGPWGFTGANPTPPPAPKSKKGLYAVLALIGVVVVAVAATIPLWWPKSEEAPALPDQPTIAAAHGTTCAIRDAELFCWGANADGQLGNGSTSQQKSPAKVASLKNVTAVAVGGYKTKADAYTVTTCAVADGSAYCWGGNHYGQVGDSGSDDRTTPVKVPGLENVVAVTTNFGSTCAIAGEAEVFCWGSGEWGQLGNGDTSEKVTTPTKVGGLTGATALASRAGSVCAIADDKQLFCWGDNNNGQLGDGTTERRTTPTKVQNLTDVTSVSLGFAEGSDNALQRFACAVASGKAYCWGLAPGSNTDNRSVPVEVTGVEGAKRIAVDVASMCAIDKDDKLLCWGNNKLGQLGNGGSDNTVDSPTAVSNLSGVRQVALGTSLTCAQTDADLFCWGANGSGQIGSPQASSDKSATPVKVAF